jgi:pimeloyl-ACP methyl ester carboxylesterase
MASSTGSPTVVLVHGAFADASSWNGVTERLESAGVSVKAIVNPLRGIRTDSAYVASAINQIPGPVLAVGHSYGGAIISNAATATPNVLGLVYVSAFAPDEGETLQDIEGTSRDSVLATALQETTYPTGDGYATATELTIDPAHFYRVFAHDLAETQANVLAAAQRPVAAGAFAEKSGPPAWKNLPSWAVVGTGDTAAGADVVRSMAQRAGAEISEVDGSHVVMISQPDAVTEVVMKALRSVS